MPKLAVTRSSSLSSRHGRLNVARIRSAICRASTADTSSHTTTNSSPPKRATESPGRMAAGDLGRGMAEQGVAGGMAQRIVDHLEVVDIEEEHAQRGPPLPCSRPGSGSAAH